MIEKQLVKEYPDKPLLKEPAAVYLLCEDIKDSEVEVVAAFMLDTRLKVLRREILSIGNINSSIVDPRELFKRAIKCNAANVILVHNHPSGDIDPSKEDIKVTAALKEGGKLLHLPLLDHLIITNSNYKSII